MLSTSSPGASVSSTESAASSALSWPAFITLMAWNPLAVRVTMNSTSSSWVKVRSQDEISRQWTKTSTWLSVEMKPYPLSLLNHLTMPRVQVFSAKARRSCGGGLLSALPGSGRDGCFFPSLSKTRASRSCLSPWPPSASWVIHSTAVITPMT